MTPSFSRIFAINCTGNIHVCLGPVVHQYSHGYTCDKICQHVLHHCYSCFMVVVPLQKLITVTNQFCLKFWCSNVISIVRSTVIRSMQFTVAFKCTGTILLCTNPVEYRYMPSCTGSAIQQHITSYCKSYQMNHLSLRKFQTGISSKMSSFNFVEQNACHIVVLTVTKSILCTAAIYSTSTEVRSISQVECR